ncbi:MAG TPA: energy transducer TonB [Cytophagales bacterium]|jgi:TonB family protein
MTRWISLACLLVTLTPGYAQDLLKRVKTDYLAKDQQYDRLPTFGSGAVWLADYLFENLPYPAAALADKAEGEVLIQFTVDKTGTTQDIKVLRGAREDLDQAVVEAFTRMPRWKPALRNNAVTEAQLLFLVSFNLRDDKYITQYKTDWLLSVGIINDQAKPDVRFLLEEDRKQMPAKRSLLIQNRERGKKVRIQEKSFVRLATTGETTLKPAVVVEVLDESMILLWLEEDSTKRRKERFDPLKHVKVPYNQVEQISYFNTNRIKFLGSLALLVIGADLVFIPPIVGAAFGSVRETISSPTTWIMMGAGAACWYFGVKLLKKAKPDVYKVQEGWVVSSR